jgi:peptidoglycan/xylan/chitin deacetylase (PgdA/CDA1 family)
LLWRVPEKGKVLYLTFDDGPIPGPTEFVTGELKKFDAKATFFCIGDNVRKHPEVFEKILADGHAIGNHTFNHLKGWSSSTERYLENIDLCNTAFAKHDIQSISFFRPPYGRITSNQIKLLRDKYRIVMWDVLTHDYSKTIRPEHCLQGSVKAARPGSIVVFHDSLKAERNMTYVLPRFLEYFSTQGYKFETLHAIEHEISK